MASRSAKASRSTVVENGLVGSDMSSTRYCRGAASVVPARFQNDVTALTSRLILAGSVLASIRFCHSVTPWSWNATQAYRSPTRGLASVQRRREPSSSTTGRCPSDESSWFSAYFTSLCIEPRRRRDGQRKATAASNAPGAFSSSSTTAVRVSQRNSVYSAVSPGTPGELHPYVCTYSPSGTIGSRGAQ